MTMKLSWYRRLAGTLMPCTVAGPMSDLTGADFSVNRGFYEYLAIFAALISGAMFSGIALDVVFVLFLGLCAAAVFLIVELVGFAAYHGASKLFRTNR